MVQPKSEGRVEIELAVGPGPSKSVRRESDSAVSRRKASAEPSGKYAQPTPM